MSVFPVGGSLAALPSELKAYALSFLDRSSLLAMRLVDRQMKAIVDEAVRAGPKCEGDHILRCLVRVHITKKREWQRLQAADVTEGLRQGLGDADVAALLTSEPLATRTTLVVRQWLADCNLVAIQARLDGTTQLACSSLCLTILPPEIGKLCRLTRLDLEENQLTVVPSEIGRLSQLEELHLSSNRLSSLPSAIGELQNLRVLEVAHNQLEELPDSIVGARHLQTLNALDNHLTKLPELIGDLRELTDLCLYQNRITRLPAGISRLPGLIDVRYNALKELPEALYSRMLFLYLGNPVYASRGVSLQSID